MSTLGLTHRRTTRDNWSTFELNAGGHHRRRLNYNITIRFETGTFSLKTDLRGGGHKSNSGKRSSGGLVGQWVEKWAIVTFRT
jgi:hypothetical protein